MKRSPLRRSQRQLMRRTAMRRRVVAADRSRLRDAREVARVRASSWCEARIPGVCTGLGTEAHHLLPRSAGGQHTPDNLAWLCRADHAHIHEHPAWSYENGWLRRRGAA